MSFNFAIAVTTKLFKLIKRWRYTNSGHYTLKPKDAQTKGHYCHIPLQNQRNPKFSPQNFSNQ